MSRSTRILFPFVVLAALAAGVALFRLDAVPLRGDEAYNIVNWTREPFSDLWWHIVQREPHPIGGFFLYIAWIAAVGESVFAVRMLSVLGHLLGLAVILALARRLTRGADTSEVSVCLAGLFWVLHPLLIWHAQDARHYSLYVALTALGWLTLLRALEADTRREWALTVVVQAAAAYLFYFEAFVLLARGLYALGQARHSRRRSLHVLVSYALLGVLLIPFGLQLLGLLTGSGGGYEGNAVHADPHGLLAWLIPSLALGIAAPESALIGGVVIALVLIGSMGIRQRWLLPLWSGLPVMLVYLISLRAEYFNPRYVIAVVPALVIAAACAVPVIARRVAPTRWRSAAWAGGLGVALVLAGQVYAYFFVLPPKAPDWPALMAYLTPRTRTDSVILSDSLDPALEYYYRGEADIVFLTQPDDPALDHALVAYDTYWLLHGPSTGWAENVLRERTQYIRGDRWPALSQYRSWAVDESEIDVPLRIAIGDTAIFRGYTQVGDSLVLLYWEALAPTPVEHSIYTRLSTPDGEIALDHGLADSIISLTVWSVGAIYRDPVALPPDAGLPRELRIGLYPTGSTDLLESACGTPVTGCPVGMLR